MYSILAEIFDTKFKYLSLDGSNRFKAIQRKRHHLHSLPQELWSSVHRSINSVTTNLLTHPVSRSDILQATIDKTPAHTMYDQSQSETNSSDNSKLAYLLPPSSHWLHQLSSHTVKSRQSIPDMSHAYAYPSCHDDPFKLSRTKDKPSTHTSVRNAMFIQYVSPAETSSCCRFTAKKLQGVTSNSLAITPRMNDASRAYRKMYVHMQGPQGPPPCLALQTESGWDPAATSYILGRSCGSV
jgi:hypothetical protein